MILSTFLVGFATLAATVFLIILEIQRVPWIMEKKEENIWEITRTGRRKAFIDEVYGDPMCWKNFRTEWIISNGVGAPLHPLSLGDKLLVRIIPLNEEIPARSMFHLCYAESNISKKPKALRYTKSNEDTHHDSRICANKHWSRPIY